MKSYATRDRQYGGVARDRDGTGWYKMVLKGKVSFDRKKYNWVTILKDFQYFILKFKT